MNTGSRARLIAALLLVLVAGAGFASGMATDRLLRNDVEAAAGAPAGAQAPEGARILLRGQDTPAPDGARRVRILLPDVLTEQLDLTPEQQAAVERILREEQAAIREITERFQPQLMAVVERSRQRIQDVLTEEQRDRWQSLPVIRMRRDAQPPSN